MRLLRSHTEELSMIDPNTYLRRAETYLSPTHFRMRASMVYDRPSVIGLRDLRVSNSGINFRQMRSVSQVVERSVLMCASTSSGIGASRR